MIDYQLIGKRIKNARIKKKLTQEKLSELLDISPDYCSKIETGTVHSNLKRLSQLSEILEVPLEYLITGVVVSTPEYKNKELSELLKNANGKQISAIVKMARIIVEEL